MPGRAFFEILFLKRGNEFSSLLLQQFPTSLPSLALSDNQSARERGGESLSFSEREEEVQRVKKKNYEFFCLFSFNNSLPPSLSLTLSKSYPTKPVHIGQLL